MLDRAPFYHELSTEECRQRATAYHNMLQRLTAEDFESFFMQNVLPLVNAVLSKTSKTVDNLVNCVETFLGVKLPFDHKAITQAIPQDKNYDVYVHLGLCPLKGIYGKVEEGCIIGRDCSFFGRFHNRIERLYFDGKSFSLTLLKL